jgi:hypothetical protein
MRGVTFMDGILAKDDMSKLARDGEGYVGGAGGCVERARNIPLISPDG